MRVLFVASNPPCNASGFSGPMCESTASGKVFREWTRLLGIAQPLVINLIDTPTESNRPLVLSDISPERLKYLEEMVFWNDRVIALGAFPKKVVAKLKDQHYRLPHPSPHNRQLNDPAEVIRQLEGCFRFLHGDEVAWMPAWRRYEGFYLKIAS